MAFGRSDLRVWCAAALISVVAGAVFVVRLHQADVPLCTLQLSPVPPEPAYTVFWPSGAACESRDGKQSLWSRTSLCAGAESC